MNRSPNDMRLIPLKWPPKWARHAGAAVFLALSSPALADDVNWKQSFAACAGNSPFIDNLLKKQNQEHRPLMRIADMQAWAVKDGNGTPSIALTTDDGLTIIGKIIGPQGEDISGALLATAPDASFKNPVSASLEPNPDTLAPSSSKQAQANISPALTSITKQLTQPSEQNQTQTPITAAPRSAPITASVEPTLEQQRGMDLIFEQATSERIWFSAAKAKEGAPVVYMLADPECPHCQWTIDQMHNQIVSGEIDLRIIFTPITGVEGFNTSLSILHSDNVAQSFMAHMTSKTRGTAAVVQMNTQEADRDVVQGIVNNINWMRGNSMPGVPFFLYKTDQGTRFAFSELPQNILAEAKPL